VKSPEENALKVMAMRRSASSPPVHYDHDHNAAANAKFVAAYNAAWGRQPGFLQRRRLGRMHLIYEALKKTRRQDRRRGAIGAAKGMKWKDPARPDRDRPGDRDMRPRRSTFAASRKSAAGCSTSRSQDRTSRPRSGADEEIARSIRHKAAPQMHNPLSKIKRIPAPAFTSLPAKFRKKRAAPPGRTPNRGGAQSGSFSRRPSFDRDGNLWSWTFPSGAYQDRPERGMGAGRTVRGWPNGLKIHKAAGLHRRLQARTVAARPEVAKIENYLPTAFSEGFKGLTICISPTTAISISPTRGRPASPIRAGACTACAANGELQRLIEQRGPPHGITLNKANTHVYVAITRSHTDLAVPLHGRRHLSKTGVAIQLSAPRRAPTASEADEEDGLARVPPRSGDLALPIRTACRRPNSSVGRRGKEHRLMTHRLRRRQAQHLHITDSLNGEIGIAEMPVPGRKWFAHR